MSAIISALKDIYKGSLSTVEGLFNILAGVFLISSKTVEFGGKGVHRLSKLTGGENIKKYTVVGKNYFKLNRKK